MASLLEGFYRLFRLIFPDFSDVKNKLEIRLRTNMCSSSSKWWVKQISFFKQEMGGATSCSNCNCMVFWLVTYFC